MSDSIPGSKYNYSRRELLRRGLLGSVGLSSAAILAACGGSTNNTNNKGTNNTAATKAAAASATSGGVATSAARSSPAAAAATGGAGATSAAPSTLSGTLVYYSEDTAPNEIAWYTAVDTAFKKANPKVEIQPNYLDVGKDFFPKLQTALAAHSPPELGTVININSAFTMWSQGVLDPADDLVSTIGADKFEPGVLSSTKFDNHYLGVPVDQSAVVFWYRKDLADQAGVKAPTNWQELLDFAKKLTANGVYGIVFPYSRGTVTNRLFLTLISQNGGNIVDPDLKVVFDSPQVVEALDFYKELAQYSPPGSVDYGFGDETNAFYTGKAASLFYAGRIAIEMDTKNPGLADKIGAVAQPAGKSPYASSSPYVAITFKEAKRKDLAKLWISKFEFDPDLYVQWLNVLPGQNLTTIPAYTQTPAYINEPTRKRHPEIIKLLDDEAKKAGGTIGFLKESPKHKPNPQSGALDQGTILADMVQKVIVGNESSKSVVAAGAKQIADLMKGD